MTHLFGAAVLIAAIADSGGTVVRSLPVAKTRGVHRLIWDLRHADFSAPGVATKSVDAAPGRGRGGRGGGGANPLQGLRVEPGTYTVRLRAGGRTQEKPIVVRDDPRIDLTAADRRAWREAQREAGGLWARAAALAVKLENPSAANADSRRIATELRDRLRGLYGDLDDFTGLCSDRITCTIYTRRPCTR